MVFVPRGKFLLTPVVENLLIFDVRHHSVRYLTFFTEVPFQWMLAKSSIAEAVVLTWTVDVVQNASTYRPIIGPVGNLGPR